MPINKRNVNISIRCSTNIRDLGKDICMRRNMTFPPFAFKVYTEDIPYSNGIKHYELHPLIKASELKRLQGSAYVKRGTSIKKPDSTGYGLGLNEGPFHCGVMSSETVWS